MYQGHLRLLVGYAGSPSFGVYFTSLHAIPANQWTHVAATYDLHVIHLYINGALDSSMPFTDPFPGPNGRPLLIGNSSSDVERFLGAIDEPAVYGCILSSNEIAAIYAAGPAGKPKAPALSCSNDKTVECGTTWSFDPPVVSTPCNGLGLTPAVLSTTTNGLAPGSSPALAPRDACGNSNTCSQTVTVVVTGPRRLPVIVCH